MYGSITCTAEGMASAHTMLPPGQRGHRNIALNPTLGSTFSSTVNLQEINFSVSHVSDEDTCPCPTWATEDYTRGSSIVESPHSLLEGGNK